MGLRTRIALVTSTTVVVAAVLLGAVVHARTADDQARRAAQAAEAELLRALDDHTAGVDTGLLVNTPELPVPLRDTVERHPVRATYLQLRPPSGPPQMWAATRVGGDVVAVRQSYAAQTRTLRGLDRILIGAGASSGPSAASSASVPPSPSAAASPTRPAPRNGSPKATSVPGSPRRVRTRSRASAGPSTPWPTPWPNGWSPNGGSRPTSRTSCAPRSPGSWRRRSCSRPVARPSWSARASDGSGTPSRTS